MSSAGSKNSVLWSPTHEDKFLTFTADLSLYKVEPIKEGASSKAQVVRLCEDFQGSLLSTNSDHQYIKCLAWCPKSPPENLLAVGLASGKVVLTSFGKTSDPLSLVGRELTPKHGRSCQYLSWNPLETNLLAESLEKHRSDTSVQIWDLSVKSGGSVHAKPSYECGHAEPTSSLAWFRTQPKSLVTGQNNRFLRIFDLRETSRPRSVAFTKAVHGVQVDPRSDYSLASFIENQALLWDTRMFEKPVLTIQVNKPISSLAWCPTRSNLVACLPRDSPVIKLYDIHGASDDMEPAVVERIVQPYRQDNVSGFCWHPTHENKLLSISTGGAVTQVTVFEKITVAWSPDIYLTWGCGRQLLQYHTVQLCREASEDISLKMKRRALKGYGIQEDISQNGSLTDEPQLKNLWSWLSYAKAKLEEEQQQKNLRGYPRVLGVKALLKYGLPPATPTTPTTPPTPEGGAPSSPRSELDFLSWQLTDGHRLRSQRRVYRSEERHRALLFCGWGSDHSSPDSPYIDRLCAGGEWERAAAAAVFTLRLNRAITALNQGATHRREQGVKDDNLSVVAMALSGYYDDKNSLWLEMCGSLKSSLSHGYLRAMFTFLTCEEDDYTDILREEELAIVDRVAFACIYLPDLQLQTFVCELCDRLTKKGDLDGILLTGLSLSGVDLLQNYVDHTSDIQTAALTCLQALPGPELSKDGRPAGWVEGYRDLLDTWGLWHQRAEFDVYRNTMDISSRVQPQVCACCNFCGKSIGYNASANRNRNFMFSGGAAARSRTISGGAPMHNTAKITSCPGCRKPLPRCSLCLINMGTAAGTQRHRGQRSVAEDAEKLTSFSDWFTWCQTCRHGGHADHMTLWFRENAECPVTGCACKCTALDTVASTPARDS